MSLLLEIQKQIQTANQRILTLERALRDHPGLPSIAANLDTAVRVKSRLEQQFAEAAQRAGYDICRYRAFDDHDTTAVSGAFKAIAYFQRLLSVVYGALKHGRKQRATVSDEVSRESSLGFGYAFAGSVGVVLTVRSQTVLFGDPLMDESFETVFALAKARNSDDILEFAHRLGPGPINALYEWADDNANFGLNAEIDWRKGDVVRKSILVQRQELSRLRNTIYETSSEETETFTVNGILAMADVTKNQFRLERENLKSIAGSVEPGVIDHEHVALLPKPYQATIVMTTTVRLSTFSEETRYHLTNLVPLDSDARDGPRIER